MRRTEPLLLDLDMRLTLAVTTGAPDTRLDGLLSQLVKHDVPLVPNKWYRVVSRDNGVHIEEVPNRAARRKKSKKPGSAEANPGS